MTKSFGFGVINFIGNCSLQSDNEKTIKLQKLQYFNTLSTKDENSQTLIQNVTHPFVGILRPTRINSAVDFSHLSR